MPPIPSTRNIKLDTFQSDIVQWTLTRQHSKLYFNKQPTAENELTEDNTMETARILLEILHKEEEEEKKKESVRLLAERIKRLYKHVKFSSKSFVNYSIQNTQKSKIGKLLELYYALSNELQDTLALRLNFLLSAIKDNERLGVALCEVLRWKEQAGKDYIMSLNTEQLNYFLIEDGKIFFRDNDDMKWEKMKRFYYVLHQYQAEKETCLNQLVYIKELMNSSDTKAVYYEMIEQVKKQVLFKTHTKESLILEYLSFWFFEFNQDSTVNITDYTIRVLQSYLTEENVSEKTSSSLFINPSADGCRKLVADDKDALRIFDIMDSITQAILRLLEEGHDSFGGLAILLAFAQFTLHYIRIDLTYPTWFESTFVNPKTTALTKRMHAVFLKTLEETIPYELPSILQVHGKAILHHSNDTSIITHIRTRLLELGVDNSLKRYPETLGTPLQRSLAANTTIDDEVRVAIEQFIKREGSIPTNLLQNFVFRRQWFIATFLPALFSYDNPSMADAKFKLIKALKEKGKIPETVYRELMRKIY
ncbi:hypothetical protein G6F46_009929 [Rhizopus delemar]|uniref:Fanconi anaemia group A protein helical domain-containing protein n=2 Tax=Rhizopus TaxID=4842 RepID=A0A9P7CJV4_9FUNG|nr:hypothetical protein G6F55_010415 [Rhizopus delemar]KAG1536174.1 hypothetical protein G6F51_011110 [Rhizopus arrhizus]KAG1490407.1 hypothetical protein G6F54_010745 [Rhizopus delemar]KAG1502319.1 hypothetical protein G6F53_010882 [Rhizopus delemar]KAG1519241.1 hypothetical protein G6F52_008813 [Rhizopus delemar]